jgi:hypothetical protein
MTRLMWTQRQDIGPSARMGHSMAFDEGRGRTVLFGGASGAQLLRETWEWDGENWTQVADTGPSARRDSAMAFDGALGVVVLFGGGVGEAGLADTWQWDGRNWTQVANEGPSPRAGHAMASDSVLKRLLLFGGESPGAGLLRDTWEWDGGAWTQLEDIGPAPRRSHALAFDRTRGRLVLFGGAASSDGIGDTWEWDGTSWIQVADFGADPCLGSAMVFNGQRMFLFGGLASMQDPSAKVSGTTWEWDAGRWMVRQDIGPAGRWGHAMAWDRGRERVVLFGGNAVPAGLEPSLLGDTWEFDGAAQATVILTGLALNPQQVDTGGQSTATVTLNIPAPDGGVSVWLEAPGAPVKFSSLPIEIPAGFNQGQGTIEANDHEGTLEVTITARLGGSSETAVLTLI